MVRPPRLEQSKKEFFTSHAGLSLIGQCVRLSCLEERLASMDWKWGIPHSAIVTSYLGLLSIGKSDFEAVEGFRKEEFFKEGLNIQQIPSASRLRQRMDETPMEYARATDEANIRFLEAVDAKVTPLYTGHAQLDLDLFPQDNSGTKKEGVSRTYKDYDGYGVMAGYLGREGWCLVNQLKPGSENGQLGFGFILDQVLPRARRLTDLPILMRVDSGHDALENRVRADDEEIDFIIKWNPRKQSPEDWLAHAERLGHWTDWEYPREGKRVATFTVYEEKQWRGQEYTHRRVMRVTERSIDKRGNGLLIPVVEVEGWWTSLEYPDHEIIRLYKDHATSEQFHSEFKTDLDLERLPSGKFETNELVMAMGAFVYNMLRWIGLVGLIGEDAPVRHKAQRRRVRTVMQEFMYLAAKVYQRSRYWWIRFSAHCPAFAAFQRVYERLRALPLPT